ncbi:MAG: pseudouridine synthase [Myxococcales bacterium]|nr:pseudouridine synthase [Myxococcales bacterium]
MAEPERLQKFLARAGVASRRACETLIVGGRVSVNGQRVTELGTKVDPTVDVIELDGLRVNADARSVYLLLNKPTGTISAASDPEGRPVVTDLVSADYGRVFPVGRLDWDSEGALILTNDGELANLLTHPRHEVQKTYMAKVKGLVGDNDRRIDKLRDGVQLEDHMTLPAEVVRDSDTGKHTWFVVGLREGKNRQVRRMFEAVGLEVIRLRRVAYGPVVLGDLSPGDVRRLSEEEIEELYEAAGATRPALSSSRGRLPVDKRAGKQRVARSAAGPAPEKTNDRAWPPRDAKSGAPPRSRTADDRRPPRAGDSDRPQRPSPNRWTGEESPAQRRDGGGAPQRRDSGGAPQRRDGGGAPQRRDGGGAPQRRDSGGAPQRRDGGGAPQRRDGGAPQRRDSDGAPQRRDGGGAPQRRDGGGAPQRRDGGGAPQRRDGGGAPQRRDGGGAPQRRDGGGAPQRRDGGGAPQRRDGGGAPQRRDGGGAPQRREGGPDARSPRPKHRGPRGRS